MPQDTYWKVLKPWVMYPWKQYKCTNINTHTHVKWFVCFVFYGTLHTPWSKASSWPENISKADVAGHHKPQSHPGSHQS